MSHVRTRPHTGPAAHVSVTHDGSTLDLQRNGFAPNVCQLPAALNSRLAPDYANVGVIFCAFEALIESTNISVFGRVGQCQFYSLCIT